MKPEKEHQCCKCNCPIHVWHNCCNWYCCPDYRKEASHSPQQEIGKQGTRTYEETVETIKDMEETEEWERKVELYYRYYGSEVVDGLKILIDGILSRELQKQEKRLRREFSDNHE